MAATDFEPVPPSSPAPPPVLGSVLLAALLLPGLHPNCAQAEQAPEQGVVAVKLMNYQDAQPGLKRIHVFSPALYVLVPVGSDWSLEGSATVDHVSGASPTYHSAISGATTRRGMEDERRAFDFKLSRYFEQSSHSLSVSLSDEHDFHARALAWQGAWSSDDRNRNWQLGLGYEHDRISSVNNPALHEQRQVRSISLGVTQAWTALDLLQLSLSYRHSQGDHNDPYKTPDRRPRLRQQTVILGQWNHHLPAYNATLRSSYRFYRDSFGVQGHTLQSAWVQPITEQFSLTPELRYTTQRAARFYYDPVYDASVGAPYPPGFFSQPPAYASADQRLGAFGGLSLSLRADWSWDEHWHTDLKLEHYQQRANWRMGGHGSLGIAPFRATFLQWGLSRSF